jgi:Helix-turn-helix domain
MNVKRKPKEAAPPIGDRLLTLREAADVLRLSTRTIREYAQRGEIEPASWQL